MLLLTCKFVNKLKYRHLIMGQYDKENYVIVLRLILENLALKMTIICLSVTIKHHMLILELICIYLIYLMALGPYGSYDRFF